jgi:hypothetical protein
MTFSLEIRTGQGNSCGSTIEAGALFYLKIGNFVLEL